MNYTYIIKGYKNPKIDDIKRFSFNSKRLHENDRVNYSMIHQSIKREIGISSRESWLELNGKRVSYFSGH